MSHTPVVGNYDELPNCCGVYDIGGFSEVWMGVDEDDDSWTGLVVPSSGTGLLTATFVDTEACREAYAVLVHEHRLLYQSPLKYNSNSGRDLFLCVFQWQPPRAPRNRRGERLPNL